MEKVGIYYRMADVKLAASKLPPVHKSDILAVTKLCLRSFVQAFKGVDCHVHFLVAKCETPERQKEYADAIKSICTLPHDITFTDLGINESCLNQYDLYIASDYDNVLFQEYDYLWRPDTGAGLVESLLDFEFVTPYDHPDKYGKEILPEVCVTGGHHWKVTESTTATFATTRKSFTDYKMQFYNWGYLDHDRWLEIGQYGGKLWSPLPSMATHMVAEFMSPHVDWDSLIKKYNIY